ncbi:MAG: HlyD family efflux transporter periplasmic adaptor subunit [Gemmatimonadota bacterium]
MDKARTTTKKKRGRIYIAAGVAVAVAITLGLSQLEPAAPAVDSAGIWTDSVQRGPFVRQVRGVGTLVPENIRIIPARTSGRVEEIYARPGTAVVPGTLLVRLSNPELDLQLLQAERDLRAAQSQLVNLRSDLQTQILSQEGVIAQVQAQYNEALRQARTNEELLAKGLIAPNEASRVKDQVEELRTRLEIEKKSLSLRNATVDTQVGAQEAQVEQLEVIVAHRRADLASMNVNANSAGVLQQLDLDPGQWVVSGTELARVVEPGHLKAELRVSETQMRDVVLGQTAYVDTRNDTIQGRVVRIDPAAQTGTIGVDVAFEQELPASARADMSVDGVIEIDRLNDVLFVGRPNFGTAGQTVGLWVLSEDGKTASRVQVRLGQTSVNHVEIVQGLEQGDVVILSDMQQWESYDKVRIN